MKQIYLDHAAATPLDPTVLAAMQPYLSVKFHNPSATYLAAQTVRADIDKARAGIAKILGTRPGELVFTAGGTEANNLAIQGVMSQYPDKHMIVSAIEHESVLAPAQLYNFSETPVDAEGVVDIGKLQTTITDQTVLVSIMYANNEIGTIQPLARIAHVIKEVRHHRRLSGNDLPLYFHTDACQAGNYLQLLTNTLGVDLMTLNAGKLYGPKQAGGLYVKRDVRLQSLIRGGGQEHNLRSGTENISGIIGFAKALEVASAMREQESKRLRELQRYFIEGLSSRIPDVQVNGSVVNRLPNNVHVTFKSKDNERLLFALDEAGIQAAAGSACSASNDELSHVLRAIGLSDKQAQSSLRFSMGRQTTKADITRTIDVLAKLVA